jgi:penicillin-binding protein A
MKKGLSSSLISFFSLGILSLALCMLPARAAGAAPERPRGQKHKVKTAKASALKKVYTSKKVVKKKKKVISAPKRKKGLSPRPRPEEPFVEDDQPEHSNELEKVNINYGPDGITLESLPNFTSVFAGRSAGTTDKNQFVFFTVDPALQSFVSQVIRRARADHVAIVAMEPSSGRVLAIGGRSRSLPNIVFHNDFPAASLFKVVTAAAALERGQVQPDSLVRFRGGDYTLGPENFRPDSRRDKRQMSISEALGKSCNPVFGRLALTLLNSDLLRRYAERFGFNSPVARDVRLPIPDDDYELSRTAAGFGEVKVSPIHAASMMAGVANEGKMPSPMFVDRIVAPTGVILYKGKSAFAKQIVHPRTAKTLLEMMESTTTIGTSRREFMFRSKPIMNMRVAAKTGTLSGQNPKGLNLWFIAAAPIERPKIAISVIVVNRKDSFSKASHLGRLVLERFFRS